MEIESYLEVEFGNTDRSGRKKEAKKIRCWDDGGGREWDGCVGDVGWDDCFLAMAIGRFRESLCVLCCLMCLCFVR